MNILDLVAGFAATTLTDFLSGKYLVLLCLTFVLLCFTLSFFLLLCLALPYFALRCLNFSYFFLLCLIFSFSAKHLGHFYLFPSYSFIFFDLILDDNTSQCLIFKLPMYYYHICFVTHSNS